MLICNEYDAITAEYCNSIKESAKPLNMVEKNELLCENIKGFKDLSISTKSKYDSIKIMPFSKYKKDIDKSFSVW